MSLPIFLDLLSEIKMAGKSSHIGVIVVFVLRKSRGQYPTTLDRQGSTNKGFILCRS